jgi:hypothetical protein
MAEAGVTPDIPPDTSPDTPASNASDIELAYFFPLRISGFRLDLGPRRMFVMSWLRHFNHFPDVNWIRNQDS